jgi:hypothetical protein
VSFTVRSLYSWKKGLRYPLNRRMGGLRIWSGRGSENRSDLPRRELNTVVRVDYRLCVTQLGKSTNIAIRMSHNVKRRKKVCGVARYRGLLLLQMLDSIRAYKDLPHPSSVYVCVCVCIHIYTHTQLSLPLCKVLISSVLRATRYKDALQVLVHHWPVTIHGARLYPYKLQRQI